MKKIILVSLLIFLIGGYCSKAQTYNEKLDELFTQKVSPSVQFLMLIDTIDKYLYRSTEITQKAIQAGEVLLQEHMSLPDSLLLEYAIRKIYYEQNNKSLLACYQIIKDNEHFLDKPTINREKKGEFRYIRAFTYMTLGDFVEAQQAYYNLLEEGHNHQDTSLIISSLYSLGQLYGDQGDYETAIAYFKELTTLSETSAIRTSTRALIDYELSEVYINSGQNERALAVIERGLRLVEKEKINQLKMDFLLLKGELAFSQNDFEFAQKIDKQITVLAQAAEDQFNSENMKLFHARVLESNQQFQLALQIYEEQLVKLDTTQLSTRSLILAKAHKVANVLGNIALGYQYLLEKNEVDQKINANELSEQTAYYKIKFESEQREKENQELTFTVLQEKNRNRLLYLMSAVFFLGLMGLYSAFSQKKKYNHTLKKEIEKQTQELEHSNQSLTQSNEELTRFAFMATHDLKTPLHNIINFIGLLETDLTPYNNEQINMYLAFVKKAGKRMDRLIDDTLKFSQLSFAEQQNALDYIDLNKLLFDLEQSIINSIDSRNAQILVESPLPRVKGNDASVNLLFQNLVDNALKYNQSTLPMVRIYATENSTHHSIFLADNGIGISPDYQSKIFVMYKRLHNHEEYEGTGIGLALCKKIVNQMNGEILVQSQLNKGSTFEIRLPKN